MTKRLADSVRAIRLARQEAEFCGLLNQIRGWYPELTYLDDFALLEKAESKLMDLNECDDLTPLEVEKIEALPQIKGYLQ